MKLSLRGLRFPFGQTRGRRYPEPPHPYRNEFQRDRDRVVHARAFRRLEDKTQVFSAGLSDHFRNRLTHTIEVSQISRTVATVLDLDEQLTEALALAHDIGHPPFAHAGEEELDRRMRQFGERFDHNLHALRIVESFEQRYARFPGLNLTFEVREGIVKHSRDLDPGENPDLDDYLPGLRPPLEAQLIDLADEIAYNTADLDDGFAAGLFSVESVAASVPSFSVILETVSNQFPGASERVHFLEALRRLIDLLVSGLIEGTFAAASEARLRDVEDVRRFPGRLACFTPEARATDTALKDFLRRNVYASEGILEERERSTAMLSGLFEFLLRHPDRLPSPYREQAGEGPVHRVVCDYIAGMTDGFLKRTFQRTVAEPE
ncbi:MAG TPA: dNTP triphosphohydrolase [Bryobacteraceae bacterium]|nr:dNTP triphosphohydrolase [Bryobacteraceae bacterium]